VSTPRPVPAARPPLGATVAYLLAVAGVAAGITLTFLGMRAVMDIGGYCAEGGPYVIETSCPEGVPLLMTLGILGGVVAAFVAAAAGSRLGGAWSSLLLLAWPALFGALGWNFLEYGLDPPGDEPGWAWGWLICGVVFWVMAFGPLVFVVMGVRASSGSPTPGGGVRRVRAEASRPSEPDRRPGPSAAQAEPGELFAMAMPDPGGLDVEGPHGPADLVDGLERLAALRAGGELSADEYAAAKQALIRDAESSP